MVNKNLKSGYPATDKPIEQKNQAVTWTSLIYASTLFHLHPQIDLARTLDNSFIHNSSWPDNETS